MANIGAPLAEALVKVKLVYDKTDIKNQTNKAFEESNKNIKKQMAELKKSAAAYGLVGRELNNISNKMFKAIVLPTVALGTAGVMKYMQTTEQGALELRGAINGLTIAFNQFLARIGRVVNESKVLSKTIEGLKRFLNSLDDKKIAKILDIAIWTAILGIFIKIGGMTALWIKNLEEFRKKMVEVGLAEKVISGSRRGTAGGGLGPTIPAAIGDIIFGLKAMMQNRKMFGMKPPSPGKDDEIVATFGLKFFNNMNKYSETFFKQGITQLGSALAPLLKFAKIGGLIAFLAVALWNFLKGLLGTQNISNELKLTFAILTGVLGGLIEAISMVFKGLEMLGVTIRYLIPIMLAVMTGGLSLLFNKPKSMNSWAKEINDIEGRNKGGGRMQFMPTSLGTTSFAGLRAASEQLAFDQFLQIAQDQLGVLKQIAVNTGSQVSTPATNNASPFVNQSSPAGTLYFNDTGVKI